MLRGAAAAACGTAPKIPHRTRDMTTYTPPRTRKRRVGGCLLETRGYPVAGKGSAGSTVTRKPNFSRRRTVRCTIWFRSRASWYVGPKS